MGCARARRSSASRVKGRDRHIKAQVAPEGFLLLLIISLGPAPFTYLSGLAHLASALAARTPPTTPVTLSCHFPVLFLHFTCSRLPKGCGETQERTDRGEEIQREKYPSLEGSSPTPL